VTKVPKGRVKSWFLRYKFPSPRYRILGAVICTNETINLVSGEAKQSNRALFGPKIAELKLCGK
jgi:hypothetical protein